jgi:hypothetical protein
MVFVRMVNPIITGSAGKIVNAVPRDLKKVYMVRSTQVHKYFTPGRVSDYYRYLCFPVQCMPCTVCTVYAHTHLKKQVRASVQTNSPGYHLRKMLFEFMLLCVMLVRL